MGNLATDGVQGKDEETIIAYKNISGTGPNAATD
jgi:hypothetical protein